ncbi:hypothetical protein CF8_2415 [Nocardioides sp. CF8]|nr:hypothetical protein CF8_2415 [Nocardioides sp. CF8]
MRLTDDAVAGAQALFDADPQIVRWALSKVFRSGSRSAQVVVFVDVAGNRWDLLEQHSSGGAIGSRSVSVRDRRTGRPDMLELSALAAASIEQVQVHRAALHCMDGFFGAVVPHEHHDLK